ncbi:phage tail protein [Planctobacterium marinum]|uniref:phage tail protein n=1 Tax=Planctobacterium marinum TaxID=1631968 RepID=UPI001E297689|nr:tail fiber protein [Planctobacterium marinum]MCC2606361.1 tail fiber protein [Planctobacterium marinum]
MAMIDPFLGQISITGFNWAPVDWAKCDGQITQISQNSALFALLGVAYGGNGQSTFGYPDLRGRTPMGLNPGIDDLGAKAGLEDVVLTTATMPGHSHALAVTDAEGDKAGISGRAFAIATMSGVPANVYTPANNLVELNQQSLPTSAGGNQAHTNLQPTQVVNFVLCISGLFPPRN